MIKKISDSTTAEFFPENFSNELYYSKFDKEMHPFSYESALSIKYNHSGLDYYRVGNIEHKLRPHQYIIINSGTHVCSYTKAASEGMSIFISTEHFADIIKIWNNFGQVLESDQKPNTSFTELPFYCNNKLGRFVERVFRNAPINQKLGIEPNPQFYFTVMELMVQDQMAINSKTARLPHVRKAVKEEIYRRLMIGKEFMDCNICHKITLKEISKIAGISSYYFIKCFCNIYGVTPYQYILKKRIELAKSDLERGDKSIQEISVDRGFTDIYSFSKYFKKVYGCAPSKYISNKL